MSDIDINEVGWGISWLRDPWAAEGPDPIYGAQYADAPALIIAVTATPVDDGTPAYLLDDGSGSPGWVIVVDNTPVRVSYPDIETFQSDVDTYDIPDGVTTWVDDDGSGSPGYGTTTGGGAAVPVRDATGVACGGATGTSTQLSIAHTGSESGNPLAADLLTVGTIP